MRTYSTYSIDTLARFCLARVHFRQCKQVVSYLATPDRLLSGLTFSFLHNLVGKSTSDLGGARFGHGLRW